MTLPVINQNSPLVNAKTGTILPPWNTFFQQFTQAPSGIMSVIVGTSPFNYIVKEPGSININGGTVSNITLSRGNISLDMIGDKQIIVEIKDVISVTFSVKPNILFIPRY